MIPDSSSVENSKRKIRSDGTEDYHSSSEYETYDIVIPTAGFFSIETETAASEEPSTQFPPTESPLIESTTIPSNDEDLLGFETITPTLHSFIMDNTPPWLAPTTVTTTTKLISTTTTASVVNSNSNNQPISSATQSTTISQAAEVNQGASQVSADEPEVNLGRYIGSTINAGASF